MRVERVTHDERRGDHSQACSDSVEDDLLVRLPVVGGETEQGEDSSDSEEGDSEPRESTLKWSADVGTEERANHVPSGETPGRNVTMPGSVTVVVLADLEAN